MSPASSAELFHWIVCRLRTLQTYVHIERDSTQHVVVVASIRYIVVFLFRSFLFIIHSYFDRYIYYNLKFKLSCDGHETK